MLDRGPTPGLTSQLSRHSKQVQNFSLWTPAQPLSMVPKGSGVEPGGAGEQVHLLPQSCEEALGSVLPQRQHKGDPPICTAPQAPQEGSRLAGSLLKLHATQEAGHHMPCVQLAPACHGTLGLHGKEAVAVGELMHASE